MESNGQPYDEGQDSCTALSSDSVTPYCGVGVPLPCTGLSGRLDRLISLLGWARQVVVILCGIPGCGKSTFCRSLTSLSRAAACASGRRPAWETLNQDTIGSRNAVIHRAALALQGGCHIVIDRCNFDVQQRSHWIRVAHENSLSQPTILAVVMPHCVDVSFCAERAALRGDSDGVHPAGTNWRGVCNKMAAEFVYPDRVEGFDDVVKCDSDTDVMSLVETLSYLPAAF